jgi:acetyl-CoA carboxylase carboxyltransferase component
MEQRFDYEKQHKKGKLHAMERIEMILDKKSFHEIGSNMTNYNSNQDSFKNRLPYDGVITGYGEINKQKVFIYSQDFTVQGGTLGLNHGKKISNIINLAIKAKCPIIGINDSGGARIQEGVNALAGYGEIFYYNTLASGYIPQISIIAGTCAGGAVYSSGITDFIFVIDQISQMYVTGNKVIQSVTGEKCTLEELGGARAHATTSGVAHFYDNSEAECFDKVRRLVTLLSGDAQEKEKVHKNLFGQLFKKQPQQTSIDEILPESNKRTYDMKKIIDQIADPNTFLEVSEDFAQNLIVGFARLDNKTVGIVANQPASKCGALDCDASDKGARFVRFCDAYDIPIITLVDVPGFIPSVAQEHNGIIRHGAKLLYAYSEATTIKITVVVRKAYGGAYIAMGSKHLRTDFVYAWDKAEIAVMGADGAVQIIHQRDINQLQDNDRVNFINEKVQEYTVNYMNSNKALEEGYVDEILAPNETRNRLISDIAMLSDKKETIKICKKHGCIPL